MLHPTLGTIQIVVNPRARRFTFRPTKDGLKVTMPLGATERDLTQSIETMLPKLVAMRERFLSKQKQVLIDENFRISTPHFTVDVSRGDTLRPTARFSDGHLHILCPTTTTFNDPRLQDWFVMIIEEALRHQSRHIVISRLHALAAQHGFTVNSVSIRKTHGRWGSCSTKKSINISLYLLLLPSHLQDYVILHELCHTVEMNHSPKFWALLDKVCGCQSEVLRQEMKRYDTNIFTNL